MKQGVLTSYRVRLLLKEGQSCFRARRHGGRRKKSVRGCIVSGQLSVLHLVIVKRGPNEIAGLTDEPKGRRLGPKRATKIRKLFQLSKEDDVRNFVVQRKIHKNDKTYTKSPKIQRLVTPQRLQRKRAWRHELRKRIEKSRESAKQYNDLVAVRSQEAKEKKAARRANLQAVASN